MKRTIALVSGAIISCTALAAAQTPSQPPPIPPAGQAPARPGGQTPAPPVGQTPAPPVGQTPTPPAGKASAYPVGDSKKTDSSFIKKAAMGGMAEVDLGQLASSKASDDKVKSFAQRMVTDHGQANDELKSLAASKEIAVPSALDSKHQATHERLAKLSGSAFDRAYVADMLEDHKKDVAEFTHQSTAATDPDVKAWVTKTLPTLQEHLKMIEELSKDLRVATATRSTN